MLAKTIERHQAGRNSIQTSQCVQSTREVCIFEVPLLHQSQEGVGWHGRPIQSSRFGPDGPGGTLVTSKPPSYSYWWYLMAETRTWGCGKSIWVHSSIAIHGWKIHHFGGISMYRRKNGKIWLLCQFTCWYVMLCFATLNLQCRRARSYVPSWPRRRSVPLCQTSSLQGKVLEDMVIVDVCRFSRW